MVTFLLVLTSLLIDATAGRTFISGFVTALACVAVARDILDAHEDDQRGRR